MRCIRRAVTNVSLVEDVGQEILDHLMPARHELHQFRGGPEFLARILEYRVETTEGRFSHDARGGFPVRNVIDVRDCSAGVLQSQIPRIRVVLKITDPDASGLERNPALVTETTQRQLAFLSAHPPKVSDVHDQALKGISWFSEVLSNVLNSCSYQVLQKVPGLPFLNTRLRRAHVADVEHMTSLDLQKLHGRTYI